MRAAKSRVMLKTRPNFALVGPTLWNLTGNEISGSINEASPTTEPQEYIWWRSLRGCWQPCIDNKGRQEESPVLRPSDIPVAFLVYLEPIERVWWLQMSFFPNVLAVFEGPLRWCGKREEGQRQEKTTYNFWLRRWSCMPYTHYECFEAVAYKNSRWEIGLYFAICRREAAVPCISIDRRLQTTSPSSLWRRCYTVARTRRNCCHVPTSWQLVRYCA